MEETPETKTNEHKTVKIPAGLFLSVRTTFLGGRGDEDFAVSDRYADMLDRMGDAAEKLERKLFGLRGVS
jgi:hypothetical protein